MPTRYYKKPSPKQPVIINGNSIMFDKVNIELGIFRTDDAGIQAGITHLQGRGIGGVFDIDADEYNALSQKKTMSSQGNYRDEFGKGPSQIVRPDNDLVSRAAEAETPAVTEAQPVAPAATTLQPSAKPLPRVTKRAQN